MSGLEVVTRRDDDAARGLLEQYFARGRYTVPFTGAFFERFAGGGDNLTPNEVTSDDLVALTMLGVNAPPEAARRLLADPVYAADVSRELARFDTDLRFQTVDRRVLDAGGDASMLWQLVRGSGRGMGRTKTSKLLARKRPHLFPVWDSVVAEATAQDTSSYWTWLRDRFDAEDGALPAWLRSVAQQVGALDDISEIRLFDVIIWMDNHER